MLQLLCSRLAHLQCTKDHPLTCSSQPVRPIVMSQSRDDRPKKRVTFNSSSIVFIIASNDTDPLDFSYKCRNSSEFNVIQVRPLWPTQEMEQQGLFYRFCSALKIFGFEIKIWIWDNRSGFQISFPEMPFRCVGLRLMFHQGPLFSQSNLFSVWLLVFQWFLFFFNHIANCYIGYVCFRHVPDWF